MGPQGFLRLGSPSLKHVEQEYCSIEFIQLTQQLLLIDLFQTETHFGSHLHCSAHRPLPYTDQRTGADLRPEALKLSPHRDY